MKKIIGIIVAVVVVAVVCLTASKPADAQSYYADVKETLVTNYIATAVGSTNAQSTVGYVLPALTTGNGQYSYIRIVPADGCFIAYGRVATNTDVVLTTSGKEWRILSVNGGPYRNDAISLKSTNATTTTATVEAWKVVK